jgi:uncharacterized membrane protein
MNARRVALVAFWLLLALQIAWHGWWVPPTHAPRALLLVLLVGPLLPPAIGLVRRRPNALFWGALVSLLHFSHAVMELWTDPAARLPAALALVLSLLLIGAVGHDGLRRRRAARKPTPGG